jgi:hypothetical protein
MVHVPGYARRDHRVVDYELYELEGTHLSFRGPPPPSLAPGSYFACVGAAQTFGCLCPRPWPSLLEKRLGVPALNLGYGGAGPAFFLEREELLAYVNRARFAVVQVLSGRSESNALFEAGGLEFLTRRSDGARLGADRAWRDVLAEHALAHLSIGGRRVYFFPRPPRALRELVAETRRNWLRNSLALLERIRVPVVLLWLSRRRPQYRERYLTLGALFGEFPQLVNREMLEPLRSACDHYVECATSRGLPQPLVDRFTGEPTRIDLSEDRPDLSGVWSLNRYYPSPEMHEDAASALEAPCRHLDGR